MVGSMICVIEWCLILYCVNLSVYSNDIDDGDDDHETHYNHEYNVTTFYE